MFLNHIRHLVKLNIKAPEERTLLHLAVDTSTSDFEKYGLSRTGSAFPSLRVTELLAECGTSMNVTDADLNTPLHVLAESFQEDTKPTKKVKKHRAVAEYLVSKDADLTASNSRGETAGQALSKVFPDILN